MAEFCKECFVRINKLYYKGEELVMSDNLDFCEGCEEVKEVVLRIKKGI
jgi:hypothetical protein